MKEKKETEKKDYPKEFRKIARSVSKDKGFTRENADAIAGLVIEGGWLFGIICFPSPRTVPGNREAIGLEDLTGDFAMVEYGDSTGKYIPLYTSEDYAANLALVTHLFGFEYAYCRKFRVKSVLDRADECGINGVILNPQIEGITFRLADDKEKEIEK